MEASHPGWSGTAKELIARAILNCSRRSKAPFMLDLDLMGEEETGRLILRVRRS
jgi:hypothetical protein